MREVLTEEVKRYGSSGRFDPLAGLSRSVGKGCLLHAGISQSTYYQWKSKYDGMEVSELKRVRDLEAENNQLKRL